MRPIAFALSLLAALLLPSSLAAAEGWTWPVDGRVLTQFRNGNDPYAAGQHRGIDIAAPTGTAVVAAAAGTVVHAGVVGSSGLVVAERTADGRLELSYLHLASAAVRRGDTVEAGTRIGAVGVSGSRSAEQPHLHFGVRDASDRHGYLDPLRFLPAPPADVPQPRPVPVPASAPVAADPAPVVAPGASAAPDPVPAFAPVPGMPFATAHAPAAIGLHAPAHLDTTSKRELQTSSAGLSTPIRHHQASGSEGRPQSAAGPRGASRQSGRHHGARPSLPLSGRRAAVLHRTRPSLAAHPAARPHRGIDLGWLAAFAGLVGAAVLLAGPGTSRGRRGPARISIGALLRAASRG